MTRDDLAYTIMGSTPDTTSLIQARALVNTTFELMKESVARGEEVKISSFGRFALQEKNARMVRNPQTGEPMLIEARRVARFKASDRLKESMRGDEDG